MPKTINLISKTKVSIDFNYSEDIISRVKQIEGHSWNSSKNYWTVPISPLTIDKILSLESLGFQVQPNVISVLNDCRELSKKLHVLGNTDLPETVIDYGLLTNRFIIADEYLELENVKNIIDENNHYPCLVLTTIPFLLKWKELFKGKDAHVLPYPVFKPIPNLKSVLFDQSHILNTLDRNFIKKIKEYTREAQTKICINPFGYKLHKELIPQLEVIDRLSDMGGFWRFAFTYCSAYKIDGQWNLTQNSNDVVLEKNLKSLCYIRRKKEDLNIPEISVVEMPVEVNLEDYAKLDIPAYLPKSNGSMEGDLKVADYNRKIEKVNQFLSQAKLDVIHEFVSGFVRAGKKLVIFCRYPHIASQAANWFYDKSVNISVDNFIASGRFQSDKNYVIAVVCIDNIDGELILNRATDCVLIDTLDVAELTPCVKAIHSSSDSPLTIYRFTAKNTIDDTQRN